MVAPTLYKIVIIRCLLGIYWHQTPQTGVDGSNLDRFLNKRDIGSAYNEFKEVDRVSPEAISQSHNGLNDAHSFVAPSNYETSSLEATTDNHDGQGTTLPSDKSKLSFIRKASIQKNLADHREQMEGMKTEWQALITMLNFLMASKEKLICRGKVNSNTTIDGLLEELQSYLKGILQLIQDRLRKWGGLDGFAIGEKHESEEGMQIGNPEEPKAAKKGSFEWQEGEGRGPDSDQRANSQQNSQILGHVALHTVIRENVESQKKASRQTLFPKLVPSLIMETRELRKDLVDMIFEKLKAASISELSRILRSINFCPSGSPWGPSDRGVRRIHKCCFQKLIIQGVHYMYKFELISKDQVRDFFLEEDIQEITGDHLLDHFDMNCSGFMRNFTFVPDPNFIRSHWHTEHLQLLLEALDEKQQVCAFYTALKETVKAFYILEEFLEMSSERHQSFIIEESFYTKLKQWQKSKINPTSPTPIEIDGELRKRLMRIIIFFQSPTAVQNYEDAPDFQRINYLLDYYILNFLQMHHPEVLGPFFQEPVEYEIFKIQLSLLQVGLDIHQRLNLSYDFQNYWSFPYDARSTVPAQVQQLRKGEMDVELKKLSEFYKNLLKVASELSKTNSKLEIWMNGGTVSSDILNYLTSRSTHLKKTSHQMDGGIRDYRNLWLVETSIL